MASELKFPTEFLHVATRDDFVKFDQEQDYFPTAFLREGFIHCCTEAQLPGVLQRYFKGAVGLRLLEIDATALVPEVKWEKGGPTNEYFPHVYGKMTRAAIVGMKVLPPVPSDTDSAPRDPGAYTITDPDEATTPAESK